MYAIGTNSAAATFFSGTNVLTVASPLASLTFLQQPSDALVSAVIAPEVRVGATNAAGAARVGIPVTLSLNGGGTLGGTVTQTTDGSGIAHFADLTVSAIGSKTLTATNAGSGITRISSSFNITNAPGNPPINVGLNGSGTNAFGALPSLSQWSTFNIDGPHNVARTDAELDTQMSTNLASIITNSLLSQAAAGNLGLAYWRSDIGRIATQPTTYNGDSSAAVLLMATLNNASGSTISQLNVNYVMACTVAPTEVAHRGHRVYYSTTGASGSWNNSVGNITNTAATFTNNISFSISNLTWAAGSPLYVVWYDEDGSSPDGDYSIDDISFTQVSTALSIALTSPTNGASAAAPATINLTATAGAGPGASVSRVAYYYTNSGTVTFVGSSAAGATYPVSTASLGVGNYGFYAYVTNSLGAVTNSSTNVVTIVTIPLTVAITSPTNTESIFQGTDLTISASTAGAATNVTFYRDGAVLMVRSVP